MNESITIGFLHSVATTHEQKYHYIGKASSEDEAQTMAEAIARFLRKLAIFTNTEVDAIHIDITRRDEQNRLVYTSTARIFL